MAIKKEGKGSGIQEEEQDGKQRGEEEDTSLTYNV